MVTCTEVPPPARADETNGAAERLDPVFQADQPRVSARIRSSYAVVDHRDIDGKVVGSHRHVDSGGLPMLRRGLVNLFEVQWE